MSRQGVLVVVSGFSGAGKGTLLRALMEKHHNYALSISATTRLPREGEVHGREYFFHTVEEFEEMIAEDRMIEFARYVNHYYGTPKDYVLSNMEEGRDVILEIEIQGARKMKEKFPEALLVFVVPPSAEELKRRLAGRGTESMDVIRARLGRAAEEAVEMAAYDYLLINDAIDECAEQMHQLIQTHHLKTVNNTEFMEQMKEELEKIKE